MLQIFLSRLKTAALVDTSTSDDPVSTTRSVEIPAPPHIKTCQPGIDCADCPNQDIQDETPLPLCLAKPGARMRIVAVDEGKRFRKRLADLGLAVGMEVRVLQSTRGYGPMILAVRKDARLAIGWGMAHKIRVLALQEG